jgi:hypothetical protein
VIVNAGLHPLGATRVSIAMYLLGFSLFLAAKVSVMREGMLSGLLLTIGLLAAERSGFQRRQASSASERTGVETPRRAPAPVAGRSAP